VGSDSPTLCLARPARPRCTQDSDVVSHVGYCAARNSHRVATQLHDESRMMKTSILFAMLMTACGLSEATYSGASTCEHEDKDCEPKPDAKPMGPTCIDDGVVIDLDAQPANVDNNDRKVTFCHATSSATNPFVIITTDIHGCEGHEDHTKLQKGGFRDVFPTGGCAD
jgi:hypothetical protein